VPTTIFCDSSHILIVWKFVAVTDYSLHHVDPLCGLCYWREKPRHLYQHLHTCCNFVWFALSSRGTNSTSLSRGSKLPILPNHWEVLLGGGGTGEGDWEGVVVFYFLTRFHLIKVEALLGWSCGGPFWSEVPFAKRCQPLPHPDFGWEAVPMMTGSLLDMSARSQIHVSIFLTIVNSAMYLLYHLYKILIGCGDLRTHPATIWWHQQEGPSHPD